MPAYRSGTRRHAAQWFVFAMMAATAAPAQGPTLQFDWPTPCSARVHVVTLQKGKTSECDFTLKAERSADGRLTLRFADVEPRRVASRDVQDTDRRSLAVDHLAN